MQYMYIEYLEKVGFTADQARVYETLVSDGLLTASVLARKAQLNRTLTYKLLDELIAKDIVEKIEQNGRVAQFKAVHPQKLKDYAEQERKRVKRAIGSLNEVLPELTSAYNLAIGKPGVRFYEGRAGVKRVLDDSLTARETILSYADADAVGKYLPDINKLYTHARVRGNVRKRVILPESKKDHAFMKQYTDKLDELTEVKFIDLKDKDFGTIMQIYDNKVSYITVREDDTMISVIIEDAFVYKMHKTLFEYMWE